MNPLKKLVTETGIYGLSSIVGRVLFFLLTPIYTNTSVMSNQEYGKLSQMFSISAFLLIGLGYGLETAFFRYALKDKQKLEHTYATSLTSILLSNILFGIVLFLFSGQIASALDAADYQHLLYFVIGIALLDTLSSIPFAYLRATNQPIRFATLKLTGIAINIGLNVFFYVVCPAILKHGEGHILYDFVRSVYNPNFGAGYAFVANLVDALFKVIALSKHYFKINFKIDWQLWKKMLSYAWPIVFVSLGAVINEVADRQLLKWFLPGTESEQLYELGVYGAVYKLSIFISLFIQAFRYAGEPFFFSQSNEKDAKTTYANVLKYFTAFSLIGFLLIALNLNIFKYFITDHSYWEGLFIVPILLMAYVINGMYYNLSVWYKLTDHTKLGAVVAIIGAITTIVVNIIFIPKFGYVASAWATLICFLIMVIISVIVGKKYFPVPYDWATISSFFIVAISIYFIISKLLIPRIHSLPAQIFVQILGVIIFMAFVYMKEGKALQQIFKRSQ